MLAVRSLTDRTDPDPELLDRARRNVQRGYQRLLSFEEPGRTGRFGLFCGGGKTDLQYTARAYQIFSDIDRIHPIDPELLPRIREALLAARTSDGHWKPSRRAMGDESAFDLTAFIVWIMDDGRTDRSRLAPSRAWLEARWADHADDPYALGLYLVAAGPGEARTRAANQLAVLLENDRFDLGRRTLMGGYGQTGRIEVESLAVLGLLDARLHLPLVADLVERIEEGRRSTGIWGSTAATVLSLKALLAVGTPGNPEGELVVRIDGREVARFVWTPRTADLLALLDLSEHLLPGTNRVELEVVPADPERGLLVSVQVAARHHESDSPAVAPAPGIEVALETPPGPLPVGRPARATLVVANRGERRTSMVLVQVPLGGGIGLVAGEGDRLIEAGSIRYHDDQPGRKNLYLQPLDPGEERSFEIEFIPAREGKIAWPRLLAYDYYQPDDRDTSSPGRVTIEGR